MLFDSGFTATTQFLNKMRANFGNNARGSLHFFALQGGNIVPASFLYSSIHQALLQAYGDIVSDCSKPIGAIEQTKVNSHITISNDIDNSDIPSFEKMPVAQERWEYIKGMAESSVDISFVFLAGMLDIF